MSQFPTTSALRMTQLATRTVKEVAREDVSRNAQLLARAGFIGQLMAGVYSYLPLGLRVLTKIENIVREEMNALGSQEIVMPALQPRDIWDTTARWNEVDVLFKLKGAGDRDLALGPTHEEVVTPLLQQYIKSYRDLPADNWPQAASLAVYQIQTKFRNEPRAKSGLLRGREFRMKDLYSFHTTQADLDAFYERAAAAYKRIYRRLGLGDLTLYTYASGGVFSKYSHEFQTVTEYGEDIVYRVPGTDVAINKEIIDDAAAVASVLQACGKPADTKLEEAKAIEVGNIFKLGTRFADAFGMDFTDSDGKNKPVIMGCYGLGTSRVMGTIAEVLSDNKGLVWPEEVAPYRVHLISLAREAADVAAADEVYAKLQAAGIEVLYDDRQGISAGEKMNDADLLGLPHRVLISPKTIAAGGVEYKARRADTAQVMALEAVLSTMLSR